MVARLEVAVQNHALLPIDCSSVALTKAESPRRIWKLAAGNRSVPFQKKIDRQWLLASAAFGESEELYRPD
jgi:hypothetical protein